MGEIHRDGYIEPENWRLVLFGLVVGRGRMIEKIDEGSCSK